MDCVVLEYIMHEILPSTICKPQGTENNFFKFFQQIIFMITGFLPSRTEFKQFRLKSTKKTIQDMPNS